MKNVKAVNEKQKIDMQESLNISKEKNEIIQKRMIRVFAKYEKLMHYQGRANAYDTQKRDMLIDDQRKLLQKIRNPVRGENQGMLATISDINSKLRCVRTLEAEQSDEDSPKESSHHSLIQHNRQTPGKEDTITDEDLEDMFKVLKKQKEGLDILT